jgi:hypothetical protein
VEFYVCAHNLTFIRHRLVKFVRTVFASSGGALQEVNIRDMNVEAERETGMMPWHDLTTGSRASGSKDCDALGGGEGEGM